MTTPFDSPLFGYIGQRFDAIDIYSSVFNSAQPTLHAGFPYLSAYDAGISMSLSRNSKDIETIFLYSEGIENFSSYQGEIPGGGHFAMTRPEMNALLGSPLRAEEIGGIGIMAVLHPYDHYESNDHFIRFEFDSINKRVRLITIGAV